MPAAKQDARPNGLMAASAIQAVNSFVMGAVCVILPLLMVDRGIDVQEIGLIFAALPLLVQAMRMSFGALSDYVGRKAFYWVNGAFNIAFLAVYYAAHSVPAFLVGKLFEATREASLWSVNRPYFMDHTYNPLDKEKVLMRMRSLTSLAESAGTMLAGFLVAALAFENTMLLLLAVAALALPSIRMLRDRTIRKLDVPAIVRSFDIRGRGAEFKNFVVIFLLLGLAWGFIYGYIQPLFLKATGVPVAYIGLLIGAQTLFSGLSAYNFSTFWRGRRKLLVGGLGFAVLVALMAFADITTLPMLVVLSGLFAGMCNAGLESVYVRVCDHRSLGRDMGVLMIGVYVGMAATQAASGFLIAGFGFPLVFFSAGMLLALFTLAAHKNMAVDE